MVVLTTYMNNEYLVLDSLPASLCEIGPDVDVFYSMHNPRFPNTATTTIIADTHIIIGHWGASFPLIFNCRQTELQSGFSHIGLDSVQTTL